MKLNPFKRDPVRKEKSSALKKLRTEARGEIREIKKIADPAVRIARYEAVNRKLPYFSSYDNPRMTRFHDSAVIYGNVGTILGMTGGTVAAAFVGGPMALLALLAVMGASTASGVVLGNIIDGRKQRQELRSDYGSVRNAKALYRLRQNVKKMAKEDRETFYSPEKDQTLRNKINNVLKRKKPAAATVSSAVNRPKSLTP